MHALPGARCLSILGLIDPRMPSGTRQFEAAGIPYDSQESTIFDILRKVLSSKVDRDDARRMATGKSNRTLNRKIENTLSFILQVWRPPCMAAEEQGTNRKKEVGKGNRRMPWLSKAKKDVISCDKPGGGAHDP